MLGNYMQHCCGRPSRTLSAGLMHGAIHVNSAVLARGLFDLANRVGTLNEGHFLLPLLTTVGNCNS
jgi:hypothetical protein